MGATLKEAVESGRRWRHKDWEFWYGPGIVKYDSPHYLDVSDAVDLDWEIEPEPEKPREVFIRPDGSWWVMPNYLKGDKRYHDADTCDRLHQNHQK